MAKSDASDNGQNQRIDWLAEQIAYHSDLYYNQAITEISDSEFDALWDELKQLEPTHSQLQRVGAEIDPGTVKVDHMFPMPSSSLRDSFLSLSRLFLVSGSQFLFRLDNWPKKYCSIVFPLSKCRPLKRDMILYAKA